MRALRLLFVGVPSVFVIVSGCGSSDADPLAGGVANSAGAAAGTGGNANSEGVGGTLSATGGTLTMPHGGTSNAGSGGTIGVGLGGASNAGTGGTLSAAGGVSGGSSNGGAGNANGGTLGTAGMTSNGGQSPQGLGGGTQTFCVPGATVCQDANTSGLCLSDGSGYANTPCDPNAGGCQQGVCVQIDACAASGRTYIGCDYYPTVTSNSQLYDKFDFGVVVANTSSSPANVTISRAGMMLNSGLLMPGETATATLPWVTGLKNEMTPTPVSALVKQGAFHVVSDEPVTVYQFNPLEYKIPYQMGCPTAEMDSSCFSYTNDASLVLPTRALGDEYTVISRPAVVIESSGAITALPGLMTVTGTVNGTMVTIVSSAHTSAGDGVLAMDPGSTQTIMLDAGDVVQILTATPTMADVTNCEDVSSSTLCKVGPDFDLTGTTVKSTEPVLVFGGHDCDFAPYDQFACDHIEDVMFPTNTWGKEALVTAPQSAVGASTNDGSPDEQLVRVMSGMDGNSITLDPVPAGANSPSILNKGEYADVPLSKLDFLVRGTGPLLVAQIMLGGNLVDPSGASAGTSRGDPSLSLAIPSEQFRSSYVFVAPSTFDYSFVNIIAPPGSNVLLDGAAVTSPPAAPIGSTGFTVTRKVIAGGPHTMTGDQPFGIVVYGYGSYTSYMYPGGLDLSQIGL